MTDKYKPLRDAIDKSRELRAWHMNDNHTFVPLDVSSEGAFLRSIEERVHEDPFLCFRLGDQPLHVSPFGHSGMTALEKYRTAVSMANDPHSLKTLTLTPDLVALLVELLEEVDPLGMRDVPKNWGPYDD